MYVVGARPNFVKMAPVIAEARRALPDDRHVLVHTGQHYDRMMSSVFMDELGVPSPDYLLKVGSATHAVQTARVMERIETVVDFERPDLVMVPGDVNSTLAATLVAAKLGVPIAHVEAGLRSFDRTMPEEINRIVADEFSDYLFIHSDEARDNLRAEGIAAERIHFVGNTMIDTLVAMEERFRGMEMAARMGLTPGEYLLVTLHRPALVDGPLLFEALTQLSRIARELPVVFPVHPRTRKMIEHRALGRVAAPGRACRLSRVPVASGRCRRSADRLRRRPGGDHLPGGSVLHPARQHRASGHRESRYEQAARARSVADRRDSLSACPDERNGPDRAAGMGWSRSREAGGRDLRRAGISGDGRGRRGRVTSRRMRIWIDFSNSPHPLLFAPVVRRLHEAGHEVYFTARDNAQTIELARKRWPDVEVIGGASPRDRTSKVAAIDRADRRVAPLGGPRASGRRALAQLLRPDRRRA